MTKEKILELMEDMWDSDLIILWNAFCENNGYGERWTSTQLAT